MAGLRFAPAEVSLEPGVSGPARDSGLELGFMSGPAVHVDGQAVPCFAWDSFSRMFFF